MASRKRANESGMWEHVEKMENGKQNAAYVSAWLLLCELDADHVKSLIFLHENMWKLTCTKNWLEPSIGADFLGALGANAPREKLQWVRRTQKNLDHKLNFSGIM